MNKLTIQINNLEALERLIGGDTQVEMEIRQSVVESFAKKHLKTMINSELLKPIVVAIRHEIEEEFFQTIKTGPMSYNTKQVFRENVSKEMRDKLVDLAKEELSGIVEEAVKSQKNIDAVEQKINRLAAWLDEKYTEERLTVKLDKMVDERIKAKLGIK